MSYNFQHSALIVSPSERFDSLVKRSLKGYVTIESKRSASLARRSILERYYDLVLIDAPLSDEMGETFALDVVSECKASVLLAVPEEIYGEVADMVSDKGVLVVPKPVSKENLDRAIKYLTSIQETIRELEKKNLALEEKLEELKIISKAKALLVEKKKMTENDAHRYIGKQAMDSGLSRKRIAERIIEEYE